MIGHDELIKRFTYHPPVQGQPEMYERIRQQALFFAQMMDELCPDSREKSRAFTHLDECVQNANAAIARRSINK